PRQANERATARVARRKRRAAPGPHSIQATDRRQRPRRPWHPHQRLVPPHRIPPRRPHGRPHQGNPAASPSRRPRQRQQARPTRRPKRPPRPYERERAAALPAGRNTPPVTYLGADRLLRREGKNNRRPL